MMEKYQIYNLALRVLGKRCTQADLALDPLPYEVEMCEAHYELAKLRALREHDWSFFVTTLAVDFTTDTPAHGYEHGYALPSALLAFVPDSGVSDYSIIGGIFYCNEKPDALYGIMDDCVETMVHPKDFDMLIAYALSYFLCPILAPGDQNASNTALQNYSWAQGSLLSLEGQQCREYYDRSATSLQGDTYTIAVGES
jgi:hypothetical protein